MAGTSNLEALRDALDFLPRHLSESATHARLATACEALGLPTPPPEEEGTKYHRALASFAALPDSALAGVARRLLAAGSLPAEQRNNVENALWALSAWSPIPARVRRELARDLHLPDLVHDAVRFTRVLDELWVLDDDPLGAVFGDGQRSLRGRIDRHVYRNPGDWTTEQLFEQLGAFTAPDARFGAFLERLASGDLSCDEPAQRAFVEAVNPHLRTAGVELRETGERDGYPVFNLVAIRSHRGRPKNLIFASVGKKPDLRFRDAVDNDVEIVGNPDGVLIYDRPIGGEGLRWRDLQTWWRETRGLDSDEEAKRSLYNRLLACLPATSPPQRYLFQQYYRVHSSRVQELPALVPEVWLHWDPHTAEVRGKDALLRFRMDFLLLLPQRQRIVLEVDGKHHYAAEDGRADPGIYARTVRGDRELKLSGYEVYRFGAAELADEERAGTVVETFFRDLYRTTGLAIA
ncbi:hypothetical protein EKG83_27185 [Saccharothrix syringae]|uniref:AbiJ-NTD3 domain-containing protein n=1 Tax=Saccharothrix syringae TaxID=103733 RepID=A0A5Q0HEX9_SACSY|nr:hypothetical protein EKG83_27185 [Saccharothrix syringae]